MRAAWLPCCGLLAAAVMLSACTAGPIPETVGPAAVPATGPTLPPRPAELRLDDVDPCTLLTSDQLSGLGTDTQRGTPAQGDDGAICTSGRASSEPFEGYLIEAVTILGAEAALGNSRGTTVTSVLGYPAIETQGQLAPRISNCIVLIDVAAGQTLLVQYDYNGFEPIDREQACVKARVAAEMALQTLIDQAGG